MKKLRLITIGLLLFSLFLSACSSSLEDPGDYSIKDTETMEIKNEETQEDIVQQEDPKEDGEMNILMIGNSYCYYYVDELYGMADSVGIDLNIYNMYYSGAELKEHWNWHTTNISKCEVFRTTGNGRKKISPAMSLKDTLELENWDVISFQEGGRSYRINGIEGMREETVYLEKLLNYIQGQFPKTQYYWHCTWVPQVGYSNATQGFYINTKEDEITYQQDKITVAKEISEKFDLPIIPTGAAWLEARYNPVINNTLCLRESSPDDLSHDGDIGGGQYLNACVWFEIITGQSCVGNTFRPNYELSEEKIAVLQAAAHMAVAEFKE